MKITEALRFRKRYAYAQLFITAIAITFFFPKEVTLDFEVNEGMVWTRDDLIAFQSFPIKKDDKQLQAEWDAARKSVLYIFERNEVVTDSIHKDVENASVYSIELVDRLLESDSTALRDKQFLSDESIQALKAQRIKEKQITEEKSQSIKYLFAIASDALHKVLKKGVLSKQYQEIPTGDIFIRKGNRDNREPKNMYFDLASARVEIDSYVEAQRLPGELAAVVEEIAYNFIKPNVLFNEAEYKREIDAAQDRVVRHQGIVAANERIVGKHEKITKEIKQKIDSYKEAFSAAQGFLERFSQFFGKFLHVLSLLLLLGIYLYNFRKKIMEDNMKLLLFSVFFLFITFLTNIITTLEISSAGYMLIVLPSVSMLITILFDSRVGFYSTIILALLIAGLRGNDYTFAVMNIIAGAAGVYSVRDMKNRTELIRASIFIFLGYAAAITMFGFERFAPFREFQDELLFALANAFVSPALTYGLLIFFERVFRITTELTLLELNNTGHPLLQKLSHEAPGTFMHSLAVANLAEAAAQAIGANALLAKVGAYYHDIGKISVPLYFIENQAGFENPHDSYSPIESVKYIRDHVHAGITLAKSNKLPQEVIDFIPTHHGTSIMKSFYGKAVERYGEDRVSIEDYRYAGPKPATRETGVVMLADSCQSAIQSLQNQDDEKIIHTITYLIEDKINDGQLSDSQLTFRDVSLIKEAIIQYSKNIRQRRIQYPDQKKMEGGE